MASKRIPAVINDGRLVRFGHQFREPILDFLEGEASAGGGGGHSNGNATTPTRISASAVWRVGVLPYSRKSGFDQSINQLVNAPAFNRQPSANPLPFLGRNVLRKPCVSFPRQGLEQDGSAIVFQSNIGSEFGGHWDYCRRCDWQYKRFRTQLVFDHCDALTP